MTLARRSLLMAPAAWAGSAWASTQLQWVASVVLTVGAWALLVWFR